MLAILLNLQFKSLQVMENLLGRGNTFDFFKIMI
jgi:hypothetical protein